MNFELWTWATQPEKLNVPGAKHADDSQKRFKNAEEAIKQISTDYSKDPFTSQQIRLPIVEKLVEHLQVQRHVFSPIKLVHKLAAMLGNSAKSLDVTPYFALLGQADEVQVNKVNASETISRTFNREYDIQVLVEAITESDTAVQANLGTRLDLPDGRVLDGESALALSKELANWLKTKAKNDSSSEPARFNHLLVGLSYFSKWVNWEQGGLELWGLVDVDATRADIKNPFKLLKLAKPLAAIAASGWKIDFSIALAQITLLMGLKSDQVKPKDRAATGDALNVIGDIRFDGNFSLANRAAGDAPEAPAGFVKIEAGKFQIGSKEDSDNPITNLEYKHNYYISRYAVTVSQYAVFVDSKAYEDQKLWETSSKQGWEWRTGTFDLSKNLEGDDAKAYKEWLARRPKDLRHQPMDWTEQLANPNRPVTGVDFPRYGRQSGSMIGLPTVW